MPRKKRRNGPTIRYTHPLLEPLQQPYLFGDNPVAKKRVCKKKVARKKGTPAPGQLPLNGVESDRDQELDRAAVSVAEVKKKRKRIAEEYDSSLDSIGELMRKKDRTSYTSAGLVFNLAHEDKIKVTKAKDK